MDLKEVGALLKRERERRGISIRDVMDTTKISRRNLTALEEGQVGSLPHPVYLKGYVRSIARMVGLDSDALAKAVDRQFDQDRGVYLAAPSAALKEEPAAHEPDAHEPQAQRSAARLPLEPAQPSSGSWRSILVLLLLAGVLVALLVQYRRMAGEAVQPPAVEQAVNATSEPAAAAGVSNATEAVTANATVEEQAGPAPEPAAQPQALPSLEPPARRSSAAEVLGQPPATAPAVSALSVAGTSVDVSRKPQPAQQAATVQPVPAPQPALQAAPQAAAQRTPGMQELVITAKPGESCWVQFHDGERAKNFTLQGGESRRLEYARGARVRLGNAGGVSFRLNGQDHPYEGKRGSIDVVEFGVR